MDYDDDITPAPHSAQIDCMARQLELAVCRNVPVELHLRHEDMDQERTSHVDATTCFVRWRAQAGCVLHCLRGPRHDGALCGAGLLYRLWWCGHL